MTQRIRSAGRKRGKTAGKESAAKKGDSAEKADKAAKGKKGSAASAAKKGPKRKKKSGPSGIDSKRLGRSLVDARFINHAARKHAALLIGDGGVEKAEIDDHKKHIGAVALLLKRRKKTREVVQLDIGLRDSAFQLVLDGIARVRRRADLEFNDGRPAAKREPKALVAFGVGQPMPRTLAEATTVIEAINEGLANPSWKSAMARRKVDSASMKELGEQLAAVEEAEGALTDATTTRRTTDGALVDPVVEMRRLTSYLRKAGNEVFDGSSLRAEFDPPAGARRKRAKRSAEPQAKDPPQTPAVSAPAPAPVVA